MFWAEIWKISDFFLSESFQFLEANFSICLNRRVFAMLHMFEDISSLGVAHMFLCLFIFLTEITCPVLNTIANGAFVSDCTGNVNSTCRFTCKHFYSPLQNQTQMTCQLSGTWDSDVMSVCVRKFFSPFNSVQMCQVTYKNRSHCE